MSLVTHLPNPGLFRNIFNYPYFVPTYYLFATLDLHTHTHTHTIMTESTFQYTIIPTALTIIHLAWMHASPYGERYQSRPIF